MTIKTVFSHNYEVEIATELPSSSLSVRHFPPIDPHRGRLYEAALHFKYLNQTSWWGVFAARSKQEMGLCLASSMPNPDYSCVVTYGTGYILNVQDPNSWQIVELYPVLNAKAVIDRQLLVLNDFSHLVAYGVDGLKWRTEAQCSDELKITDANSEFVTYTGWDAASGDRVTKFLDTLSGRHVARR